MFRVTTLIFALCFASVSNAQTSNDLESGLKTVIGPRNPDLQEGAELLLAGRATEGIKLTLRGLQIAQGGREKEAALANLCAGYVMLENYDEALKYCDRLLAQNDENWRGYNNRALIHINTGQFEKARRDLVRGEELKPGAPTLEIARSIYRDAVDPVQPQVEIDDRPAAEQQNDDDGNQDR